MHGAKQAARSLPRAVAHCCSRGGVDSSGRGSRPVASPRAGQRRAERLSLVVAGPMYRYNTMEPRLPDSKVGRRREIVPSVVIAHAAPRPPRPRGSQAVERRRGAARESLSCEALVQASRMHDGGVALMLQRRPLCAQRRLHRSLARLALQQLVLAGVQFALALLQGRGLAAASRILSM